jgi:hypothetical protein
MCMLYLKILNYLHTGVPKKKDESINQDFNVVKITNLTYKTDV